MNYVQVSGTVDRVTNHGDFSVIRMKVDDGPWVTVFADPPTEPPEGENRATIVGKLTFSRKELAVRTNYVEWGPPVVKEPSGEPF